MLIRLNQIADSCFDKCVDDFGMTKFLRTGEEDCLRRCVDKYVQLSMSMGVAFASHLDNQNKY